MSSINISCKDLSTKPKVEVHSLPCKIDANCSAKVDAYFKPTISVIEEESIQKSSFRGRPLLGRQIELPANCFGLTVQDKEVSGVFNKFTYWNWDQKPTNQDKIVQALKVCVKF